MRKLLILILLIASFYGTIPSQPIYFAGFSVLAKENQQVLEEAFTNQRSNIQVEGQGIVIKILTDDLNGSKHQRFIIKLTSGQTLLIAHNIDIAPKIEALQKGDLIGFYGEYEWNPQGGLIHWTHHDPKGDHIAGWIKHKGNIYQ
jgi:Protein of unknown function (DUF3465)